MEIRNKLVSLQESTNNPKTKRIVNGLVDVISHGEIDDNKIIGSLYESLKVVRKDDGEVDKFLTYFDRKRIVENLGLKDTIDSLSKTALYNNDIEFRTILENFQENLDGGVPEALLVDHFQTGIKRYMWNNKVLESVRPMESNIKEFKTFKLVEAAIQKLKADKNSDLYEDALRKLDYSFTLPENQVRSYVKSIFEKDLGSHPIIGELLENLYMIDQHNTSKVTHITDRTNGRVAVYERVAPYHIMENGTEFVMLNNKIYEMKDGKVRILENKDLATAGVPADFIKTCQVFSVFESVDGEGMTVKDEFNEYKVVENEEAEAGYDIKVDGEEQGEESVQELLENLAVTGTNPQVISLLENAGLAMASGAIAVIDSILCLMPENGRCVIDLIKCGDDGEAFINIYDFGTQSEELIPTADADIDAITTDIQTDYGVDVSPFLETLNEEAGEGGNGGEEDAAADAEAQAQAEAEQAQKEAELKEEMKRKQEELDEIIENMEKIETLDEEYSSEDDIQEMYETLKGRKGNLEEEIKDIEAKLNGDEPAESDTSKVAESVMAEMQEMVNKQDYITELETDTDPNAVTTRSGSVHNVDDTVSVIPVVEFEKDGNGNVQVSNAYLQVDDRGLNEEDGTIDDKLAESLADTPYLPLEDGYVSLGMEEPTAIDGELPDTMGQDIQSVVAAVTGQGMGDEDTLNQTMNMEEEEGAEKPEGGEVNEEEGAEGEEDTSEFGKKLGAKLKSAVQKTASRLKSGARKLSTGDNSMVSEEGEEGAEGEEKPEGGEAAPAAEKPENGEEGGEAANENEEGAEGGEATEEPTNESGLCPHKRVVFPSTHRNRRIAGRSGYIVVVNEEEGTAVVDFDDKNHDPMEYQPNVPIADIEGYVNETDTVEGQAKHMTVKEIMEAIEKNKNFMGESEQSDDYLRTINDVLESELQVRGKGHLIAKDEQPAE